MIEYLPWDSAHFGFPIGKVTKADPECRCVYWLVGAADTQSVRAAEDQGFRLVDVLMTLELKELRPQSLSVLIGRPGSQETSIKEIGETQQEWEFALELSRMAFRTRFHKDDGFDPDDVGAMFVQRLKNSPKILVASQHELKGYAALRYDGTTGVIDLLAVRPAARGFGIGRALVLASLGHFLEKGMLRAEVTTQGDNIAAQRLYQRCGFITKSVGLWYHKWNENK